MPLVFLKLLTSISFPKKSWLPAIPDTHLKLSLNFFHTGLTSPKPPLFSRFANKLTSMELQQLLLKEQIPLVLLLAPPTLLL